MTTTLLAYWRDETGLCSGHPLPKRLAKFALLFLIANEMRGIVTVWGIVSEVGLPFF